MQHHTLSCCGGVRASLPPPPLSFRWSKIKREGGRRLPRCARIAAQLELKPPPYSLSSLEPHMSRETLEYHWGRHHRAHVASLNNLIAGTDLDGMGLDEIVVVSYNKGNPLPLFVHAAQVWNHDFFWQSIKPGGGGRPSGRLMEHIERDFGSFDRMLEEFKRAALTQFGSGWAWLVYKANRLDVGNAVNPCPSEKDNKLVVLKSPNAVNPIVWDYSPLLAIDVWEHAYYLDYENRRADYVSIFLEKLVSWEVVSDRLDVAIERAAERAREDETRRQEDDAAVTHSEAVEMYLDSDTDDSEAE
ncbi:superoxide dismutase [Fe], chloroplastic-like isoform X2 [Musa acuminata AAA Group]|uniref:superoxide dismutase n=1 Tax=Musa acuminata AAA Group TaxID=214697 RepID=K4PNF4_MUSAC|nr:iron superoxide dismutase [Musa acuminata AAA Group]AIT56201.1 iron superoxide dismutase 1A [Musa acuminata AAA Group]AIT56202.1 iron superoxide dismutase 1A [Musa acuminata AAA Group]AIT56208.1 iron superoxide dismutase 1A [Musa acuminata AAA Group]